MIKVYKQWKQKNDQRRLLLKFLNEMEKNLETFYVIDQRQFITNPFQMQIWDSVKELDLIKKHEEIQLYARVMGDFNALYQEYKKFEAWYSEHLDHKTPDNAKKLHSMKETLQQKVKSFESIIIIAGQKFEQELLNLGYIEN